MVLDRTALWISLAYLLFGAGWVFLSDQVAVAMAPDLELAVGFGSWKAYALVAGSAVVLYLAALRRRRGMDAGREAAPALPQVRPIFLVFAALAAAMALVGVGTLAYTVAVEKDKAREQLRLVTELKLGQITRWLREQQQHADLLLKSPLANRLDGGDDGTALREWLKAFADAEGYQNIMVVDYSGRQTLAATPGAAISPELAETVRWAIASGERLSTDLYRLGSDADAPVVMDLAVPLSAPAGEPRRALVLRVDAGEFLFPLIQSWPTSSTSAETLLLRREGDAILYLNELRHRPGSALRLRVPISREGVVGVKAVLGKVAPGELVDGFDYRGTAVVGMARAALGTSWIMLAKMDRQELFAQARRTTQGVTLVGSLVLLLVAGAIVLLYQRRETSFSRMQEAAVAESEQARQLLASLAESSSDAIYAKDASGRYLLYNQMTAEIMGMEPAEVIGKDDSQLFPPAEAAALQALDRQVMAADRILEQEETLTTAAGVTTFHSIKGPLHDAAGRVIGIYGISRNISRERKAEKELRENAVLLSLFVEHAPVALAMFDREMRYLEVSHSWREDYGLGGVDLRGVSHYELFPDLPERWKAAHRRGLAGEVLRCEADRFERPDGSVRWIRWEVRPWWARPAEVGGIMIFVEDISQRVAATGALDQARAEAEQANAAKTRFLAAASHDLRQPLQGMRLLLELMIRKADNAAAVADLCDRMNDALVSSEKMLSRLMEFAALESGKVAVQPENLPLDQLVQRVVREHQGEAAAKGLRLRSRVFPCVTHSDPVLLERIVRNLTVNAVRYTERGGVLVAIRRRGQLLRVEVRDTGLGIAEDMQEIIFEEFRQLANPERDRSKGSGLGLAIVARTAKLLGHRLTVSSFEGRGSVFAIEVPALPADAPVAAPPAPVMGTMASAAVLLVEDDAMQASALEMLLTELGHRVEVAADATAALATATAMPQPPALVLSDYRLPGGVSGIELIGRLRAALGRDVPAILVTGDIQQGIAAAAAAADCQVLHKPYGVPELIALIEEVLAPAE